MRNGAAVAGGVASRPARSGVYRNGGKRLLDILLVLAALPFLLPLALLVAAAVMTDGGSPFYTQKRLGRGGTVFRLYKFRSMRADADRQLQLYLQNNPAAAKEWTEKQKLQNDPRITPVGRFIRKSSLDELPQLWNVLIGDMSLVGPRPMMVDQRRFYPGDEYEQMRPGLTGLWQVSERNGTTFSARATYDSAYFAGQSLSLDLSTMLRTVGVVLRGTGC